MEIENLKAALNPTEAEYLEHLLSHPIKSIALDCDIVLTEDEIAQALLNAKINKRTLLKYEENEKLRRKKAEILTKPFNWQELLEYCQGFFYERFNSLFEVDDSNENLIIELGKYFVDDPSFNKGSYSLKKGIMLMGPVGTGKSWLMAFFQKNKKRCFTIKSCQDIASDYLVYKDETVGIYSTPLEKPSYDPSVFFQTKLGYCYDDLGTEEDANSFGNKKNVMADILFTVYNKYIKSDFIQFHLTTNLNPEELEARYGSRIYSRFKEMFNVFVYEGKDRRK